MNKWIFFGIGVALGSGATFLAVKKHYRGIAFHEISEMRQFYKERKAELEAKYASKSDKTDATGTDISKKSGNRDDEMAENLQNLIDYDAIRARYSGSERDEVAQNTQVEDGPESDFYEDDEDPYDIFVSHEAPSEGYSEQPYQISEEEFSSEKLFFDKVIIEYYADGIAVVEETDEILDSLEDQIGPYILGKPVEEDEIYVRNEARSTDYCIQLKGTNFVPEEGND